ncbi:MAG: class I SAM-dependent methyltransferase [Planctomycetota bacterium]|jgi:2-polyprenyl-3-methyl-5-hydroxy-6-metoxy-1,4-benzoquinol methylase
MAEQDDYDMSGRPASYFRQGREVMLKYVPKNVQRTLELGCAEGNFSELVKANFGAECWGIEIDSKAAGIAAGKLDKVVCGDVSGCLDEVPDDYFDCVICNDILEHLADPYSLLISLKRKLTNDSVLVASFPNVRYCRNLYELVVKGNWDYKDHGTLDKSHLRFFTRKSIVKMFSQLGYELLTIEGLETEHNIKTAALKILTSLFFTFKDIRYYQFACVAKPVRSKR